MFSSHLASSNDYDEPEKIRTNKLYVSTCLQHARAYEQCVDGEFYPRKRQLWNTKNFNKSLFIVVVIIIFHLTLEVNDTETTFDVI
jgi:hypothetical protein